MNSTDSFVGPHFDLANSPFDPATGKLTRLFKGGKPPKQTPASAQAVDTPALVGQANRDDEMKRQQRRRANRSVIGALEDESFGNRLKMG